MKAILKEAILLWAFIVAATVALRVFIGWFAPEVS